MNWSNEHQNYRLKYQIYLSYILSDIRQLYNLELETSTKITRELGTQYNREVDIEKKLSEGQLTFEQVNAIRLLL